MVDKVKRRGLTRKELIERARKIKFVLTDSDGVLTDTGVYYGENGEMLKRFSIRDGMGVERLKLLTGIETGIITGENSEPVKRRAEKLNITELYLHCKDKAAQLDKILIAKNLEASEVAYIGDDTNDLEIIERVGLSACPADAVSFVKKTADYICSSKGGGGAFREFVELIIFAQTEAK
ncbi:MAG: KdsC family phosphatase [Ignavibacteriales bacterium]